MDFALSVTPLPTPLWTVADTARTELRPVKIFAKREKNYVPPVLLNAALELEIKAKRS